MKFALTCNNYPPEFRGGTEQFVRALAHGLQGGRVDAASTGPERDEVIVICGSELPHAGRDVVCEDDAGVPVFRIPLAAGEGYGLNVPRPRLLGVMREILCEENVEVVHVHHWSHLSDGQVRMARGLGLGCVVTLHDVWTTCPRFFRAAPAGIVCPTGTDRDACVQCANLDYGEAEDWVRDRIRDRDEDVFEELRSAQYVFAPSEACARACREHLVAGWGEILVQPHGLLESSAPPPRAPLGLPLRVGTFGNLNAEKGVLDLVAAMRGIRAELHLFGADRDGFAAAVKAQAEADGVRLVWHGAYDGSTPHPASQLDLAVFPSRCRESYGLVVDEALHHGTPVIVSDAGALPERVAAGGGLTVPVGDVDELATAIRGVVEAREAYHLLRASIPTEFPCITDAVASYRQHYVKAWAGARVVG